MNVRRRTDYVVRSQGHAPWFQEFYRRACRPAGTRPAAICLRLAPNLARGTTPDCTAWSRGAIRISAVSEDSRGAADPGWAPRWFGRIALFGQARAYASTPSLRCRRQPLRHKLLRGARTTGTGQQALLIRYKLRKRFAHPWRMKHITLTAQRLARLLIIRGCNSVNGGSCTPAGNWLALMLATSKWIPTRILGTSNRASPPAPAAGGVSSRPPPACARRPPATGRRSPRDSAGRHGHGHRVGHPLMADIHNDRDLPYKVQLRCPLSLLPAGAPCHIDDQQRAPTVTAGPGLSARWAAYLF